MRGTPNHPAESFKFFSDYYLLKAASRMVDKLGGPNVTGSARGST